MQEVTPGPTLEAHTATALADFARACKAAARAVSLYPGQHPAIAASLDRLTETAGRLTSGGALALEVRPDTLLVSGARMPRPDNAVHELADLLHRHLIGVLTINAGIDAASWRTLLLLLARGADEVRADGGIAHLWAKAGGPSIEIREIDYAEVLREKRGTISSLDDIIAAAMDGTQLLDDETVERLLAVLGDSDRAEQLIAKLETVGRTSGLTAKAAAVIQLLQAAVEHWQQRPSDEHDDILQRLSRFAGRLTAEDMLRLLAHRDSGGSGAAAVSTVLESMHDGDVAGFVAGSVVADHGASARLAHAFQALVPDIERQRRVLALAEEQAAASPLGSETNFDELWGKVESIVTSYTDANYVSTAYARELWSAQANAVDVARASDDPPERVAAWLSTVNDSALRNLDLQLLTDLLRIETDHARWRDVAETAAAHAEDLVRVGHFDRAWNLADAIIREAEASAARTAHLPRVLERFGRGSIMKHVAAYLREANDEAFERFQRLCRAVGTPVIAPLAEALSAEQDARSRRRLRDVLVGFGAQGREVVQQLMHAPNWEVRRTAAFLLREFGGAEGLRELIPLLTDNEPLVQREAVQALVMHGSNEASAIIVDALGTVSGRVRQTLVAELLAVRDRRAAAVFCYLVEKLDRVKHAPVYLAALEALGAFDEPDVVDALKIALHRGEWWAPVRTRRARTAAAAALRRLGTPPAIDVLRHAARSGSRGTRAAARAVLAELG